MISFLKSPLSKKKPAVEEPMFRNGELVRVTSDEELARSKQADVGGYSSHLMRGMLGKTVRVIQCQKFYVKVEFKQRTCDLHQDIIKKLNDNSKTKASTVIQHNRASSQEPPNNLSLTYTQNYGSTLPLPSYSQTIFSQSNDEYSQSIHSSITSCNNTVLPTHNNDEFISIVVNPLEESLMSDPNQVDPIFDAVRSADITQVYSHMNTNNINSHDSDLNTPLNLACKLGHKEVALELITFGYDLTDPDQEGNLPTHNCVIYKHFELLQEIFRMKPETTLLKNRDGKTCQDLHPVADDPAIDLLSSFSVSSNPNNNNGTFNTMTIVENSGVLTNYEEEEFPNLHSGLECKICVARPISMVLNCGHVLCENCLEHIMFICPFCKNDIISKETKKIYF